MTKTKNGDYDNGSQGNNGEESSTVRFWTGAVLMLMNILALLLMVQTMSAYRFQEKLRQVNKEADGPVFDSLQHLQRNIKELRDLNVAKTRLEDRMRQKREDARGVSLKSIPFLSDQKAMEQELILSMGPKLPEKLQKECVCPLSLGLLIEMAKCAQGSGDEECLTMIEKLRNTKINSNALMEQSHLTKDFLHELEKEKVILETGIEELSKRVFGEPRDLDRAEIVRNVSNSNLVGFSYFLDASDQQLIFSLTLIMGALGSLLYITRDYLVGKNKRNFSWYLFRPVLGMVTALAVYILAIAGQITISEGEMTGGTGGGQLNPYFICFLAIIAGLLSEQAIERIRLMGRTVLKIDTGEGDRDRWGVRLGEVVDEKKQNINDLMPFVDAKYEEVEKWVAGTEKVPYAEQRVIASWLGIHRSCIFTDIEPSRQE